MFTEKTSFRLSVLFGLLLAGSLLCAPAFSQTQEDSIRLYALDSVQISGRRGMEVVAPKRLSGALLKNLNVLSVADAMRYFAGVQIKDFGGVGGLKTINVRSMGTNHVGVFYDGIQISNAQNGQVDLGRFSLDNLEALELYNGQRSSVLQTAKDYSAATTIYLQSRRPQFDSLQTYHLTAGIKTGSFGLINPSLTWQQKINSRMSSSVSAELVNADGRYKFRHRRVLADGSVAYDTTMIRENADIHAVRAEASLFGSTSGGEYRVQVYNYYSERGLPGYIANNIYRHPDRLWDNNFFVQASLRHYVSERYGIQLRAKYANDYTRYLQPDSIMQYADNRYQQQDLYLSVANNFFIFPWWEVALSTDFQYNTLDANLTDFVYPSRYTGLASLATSLNIKRFRLQASLLGTYIHETVRRYSPSPDRMALTPAVVASVQPWQAVGFEVTGFYKRIFRMPTFNDLYYAMVGYTLLKPEYVDQFDLGLQYRFVHRNRLLELFSVGIDGYYNQVKDKIVAVPARNMFRWQMYNLGMVRIAGANLTAQAGFQWAKDWSTNIMLNYTYERAQDVTSSTDSYYRHQIPYSPWHSGSVVVSAAYRFLRLNYSFIYVGERYNAKANILENYVLPWYTHDISLAYTIRWRDVRLTPSVDVNNIFNQQYDVVLNYPMPGTNFKVSLKVEI